MLRAQALNGEGPCWDDARRRLCWVDIREPALHAFDSETGRDVAWEMPAWIGCFALTDRGAAADGPTTMVDSGFRRGTNILKGLALGAAAVFIGRSFSTRQPWPARPASAAPSPCGPRRSTST